MAYEHKLPTVLNPTGDIIVPLCIPHDPHWISLLLGSIGTLEQVDYYQRDPNYDDENAQIVAEQWRDRTITPLIEAIATGRIMKKYTTQVIDILTNKTTTSLVPVAVLDSGFNHIFTYKNAIIKCHNASIVNSAAAGQTKIQADIFGEAPEAYTIAANEGTQQRQITTIARFENLPVGVAKQIRLVWFVSSGTGTINENSWLVYEIEEYP